jgi:hypothetical protein
VRNATTLAATGSAGALSAPAYMVQRILQLPRAPGKSAISANGGTAKGGAIGLTQQPTLSATATAREQQEISSIEQQSTPFFENDQIQVSVGQDDRVAEGAPADGAQHLGILYDAMLGAGVAADGGSERELGSVMKLAILPDGGADTSVAEQTECRRG